MRDIGPTFVTDGRTLTAVDWTFNGWGAQGWARWEHDQHIARAVAEVAGTPVASSPLVNEGGAIHVDGEGTVLLTETVQLGPERNPGWTREQVEAEVHARLGTEKAIWLPRGLTGDYGTYGTLGHVDIVAAFVRPGTVVAHVQPDPAHPDHEVSRELLAVLRAATDAKGRPLEVVEVPAPTVLRDEDGAWVDYSYINHYLCNGGVVLCAFDDPRDEEAAAIFRGLFPDRTVTLVDARTIFASTVEASTASPSSSPRSDGRPPAEGPRRPRNPRNPRTMTPAPRRTHQAAPPREDVLAAVMATVAERGLDGLTMAGLGRAVGMSSGHLLYYFRTKDELLLQTLEWSENRLGAERRALLARPEGVRERLEAYIALYLPAKPPRSALDAVAGGLEPLPERRRRRPRPAGRHRGRLAPRPGGAAGRGRLARRVPAGGRRPLRHPAAGAARRPQRPRDGRHPGHGAGAGARPGGGVPGRDAGTGAASGRCDRRHDRILRRRRHGAHAVPDCCRALVRHDYWQQARRSAVTAPYHPVRRGHRAPDPRADLSHPRGVFCFPVRTRAGTARAG